MCLFSLGNHSKMYMHSFPCKETFKKDSWMVYSIDFIEHVSLMTLAMSHVPWKVVNC